MIEAPKRPVVGILALVLVVGAMVAPNPARAEPVSGADRIGGYVYDVAVLRTTGVLKTALGAVFLVPAYLLSIGSSQSKTIVERCVVDPAKDTFTRRIGDF